MKPSLEAQSLKGWLQGRLPCLFWRQSEPASFHFPPPPPEVPSAVEGDFLRCLWSSVALAQEGSRPVPPECGQKLDQELSPFQALPQP